MIFATPVFFEIAKDAANDDPNVKDAIVVAAFSAFTMESWMNEFLNSLETTFAFDDVKCVPIWLDSMHRGAKNPAEYWKSLLSADDYKNEIKPLAGIVKRYAVMNNELTPQQCWRTGIRDLQLLIGVRDAIVHRSDDAGPEHFEIHSTKPFPTIRSTGQPSGFEQLEERGIVGRKPTGLEAFNAERSFFTQMACRSFTDWCLGVVRSQIAELVFRLEHCFASFPIWSSVGKLSTGITPGPSIQPHTM